MDFDNTYARELEGCFVPVQAAGSARPRELFFNRELAAEIDSELPGWPQARREAVFGGNQLPPGAQPIAQAYAGHQFGGFSPQLGDGRALLLGELIDRQGVRQDLAFKGSGRTPFARGGDGKAAVGPMLREVLISEALHAMGIPTTRALAVVATGEWVHRERPLPGAVLTRVAASHLRVGTFEFLAARGDHVRLQRLVGYACTRHPSDEAAVDQAAGDQALALLLGVVRRQANLLAQWMGVGFIHGVMNTDNMSISGQSIDFGPCAFMEAHDPETVYSSIDHQGRYAYGRQPAIAQWNLARLAEALLPVMQGADDARLEAARRAVQSFDAVFDTAMAQVWRAKLGLPSGTLTSSVRERALSWQGLLLKHRIDHTLGWRCLAALAVNCEDPAATALWGQAMPEVRAWIAQWQHRAAETGGGVSAESMRLANPYVIPRNHQVESALAAASDEGDLSPFMNLLGAVQRPFDDGDGSSPYAQAAPPEVAAGHRTFCGT